MIDQADRELKEWVKSIVKDVDVVLEPPHLLDGKQGVSLYLLALADPPASWASRKPTVRVALRYLVTTWAQDTEQAHHLLGELVRMALEKHEYELDLQELPTALWQALGIVPRPAFTLSIPLPIDQPQPASKLVRGPLVVRGAPAVSLHGLVLGPNEIPIAGATLELPALQLSTHTDAHGYFFFASVPTEPPATQLLVKAKGYVQQVTVKHPMPDQAPVTIRFDSFEK